jgi:hypothetical protein
MFCRWCGAALPEGAATCPTCSRPTSLPTDAPARGPDPFDQVVSDTTRAARELTVAAAKLTERLAQQMQATAQDPRGATTRAARRVARDLDAAREAIENALRDL